MPTNDEARLDFYKRKSAALICHISEIKSSLTQTKLKELDESDIKVRLKLIERLLVQFEQNQEKLELEHPNEIESDTRGSFLAFHMDIDSSCTRELNARRDNLHSTSNFGAEHGHSIVPAQPKTKLPTFQIPTFDGEYTKWPDFFAVFTSLVHTDAENTEIEKFQHLRLSLQGAALNTISSLELNAGNYDKALDLLKKRFSNARLIFQAHIRDMFGLSGVETDKVATLRELSDKVSAHLRALQSMATKDQIADGILIYIVSMKLDSSTRAKWEESLNIDAIPTWSEMSDFLEKRCWMLESVAYAVVNQTPSIQNKQFVYRGLEYERIGAFTQRLQTEFPSAQILTNNNPPDNVLLSSPDQYIQISNVRPIGDARPLQTAMVSVPEKIARFYEVNDVTRFVYDRPIYKGLIDKDNEFKSLWIERTTLEISSPLPGILRWFEVKHKSVKEITPVEFACETMYNVSKELKDLIGQYCSDPKRNINPFSMRLQGIIDANVMGGICKYQEAFLSENFLKSSEGIGQQANVQKLKCLVFEQVQILERALDLHGKLAPIGVQPLHQRLIERFSQLKQSLLAVGRLKRQQSESIVNTPLPPLPTEKHTMNLNSTMKNNRLLNQNYYGIYEHDEIYTRPSETLRPVDVESLLPDPGYLSLNIEIFNEIGDLNNQEPAPPVPSRPRSQNIGQSVDSPEVPPKKHSHHAPPLPPRGIALDKCSLNPPLCNDCNLEITDLSTCSSSLRPISSSSHQQVKKLAVVDICFDDPESDQRSHPPHLPSLQNQQDKMLNTNMNYFSSDFRDSGISATSANEIHQLNNLSEKSITSNPPSSVEHDSFRVQYHGNLESKALNISQRCISQTSDDVENLPIPPPPIPPKSSMTSEVSEECPVEGDQHLSYPSPLNHFLSMDNLQSNNNHQHNCVNFTKVSYLESFGDVQNSDENF